MHIECQGGDPQFHRMPLDSSAGFGAVHGMTGSGLMANNGKHLLSV